MTTDRALERTALDRTALDRTKEILADLLAFPTISGGSNLDMMAYLAERLEGFGARIRSYPDETGEKTNLFATVGPNIEGGVILSGHGDVVPVAGQPWTVEPFAMTERDGRLYGRGAVDMKGFLAASIAMVPAFAEGDLRRPLHIAISYDEEISCLGVQKMLEGLERDGVRPAIAIIGEPTEMGIVEGHKGCFEYTTEFFGLEGHSSKPGQGVSAIDQAVRFINRLHELRADLEAMAPAGSRYDPPGTTLHVGRIEGGTGRNVIARHCTVDWELRPVQKSDADHVKDAMAAFVADTLKPAMTAIHPDADVVTRVDCEVESFEPSIQSAAKDLVSDLTGLETADVVPFGTEAGFFQAAGISSVVCGPGSIRQAHMADEFITIDQLGAYLALLGRLRSKLV